MNQLFYNIAKLNLYRKDQKPWWRKHEQIVKFLIFRFSQLHVALSTGRCRDNHFLGFSSSLYFVARGSSTGQR